MKPHNLTQITHPPAILSLTDNTDYADVFIIDKDAIPHCIASFCFTKGKLLKNLRITTRQLQC